MKSAYRVILIGLAVLGAVYASTGPEKKTEEIEKKTKEVWHEPVDPCKFPEILEEEVQYKPIDICKFPVSIDVGHYVQLKECHKRKIELKQIHCPEGRDFPCYKGREVFEVRANFPAILNATIDKSGGDEEILEEVNLYWENGVNTIQGTGDWEELKLCLEAWGVDLWKFKVGTVKVGKITIGVRPPDETNDDDTKDDKNSEE